MEKTSTPQNPKTDSFSPLFPPYLVLGLGVIAASTAAIFIRLCQAPPFIIGGYRLVLATLITLGLAMSRNRKFKLVIPGAEVPYVLLAGFFLSLHFGLWIYSLTLTKVASASILVSLQPLFVSVLAIKLFKEPLRKRDKAGLTLSFMGAFFISGGDIQLGSREFTGDILAVLSGFCGACYFLAGKKTRHQVELTNYLALVYGTAAVILGLMAWLTGTPMTGYSGNAWFWIIMLALIPTLIGHSFYNWSLKYLSAHRVGMMIYVEPLLSSLLACLFLKESPSWGTYPGALFIFTGLYLTLTRPHSR